MTSASEPVAPRDQKGEPQREDDFGVPPVVAVVVTTGESRWLGPCLRSLTTQDYPALSIVLTTTGDSSPDAAGIPDTGTPIQRRPVDGNPGYGPATNAALDATGGAAFLLLCHDDVVLAPDGVRVMVEEAFRSNAGLVSPKFVEWRDSTRLLQVGMSVDKSGAPAALVDRGELDQEQHDAVRDIFYAPGGCTLVRADLFYALGGFDEGIDFIGEDIDLSWRAHVAGARVLVAPAAVVRHAEALSRRGTNLDRPVLEARHHLRTMLTCYTRWHLVRVVPQAVLLSLGEIVYTLFAGHASHAGAVVAAWRWNLAHLRDIRAHRAGLREMRQLPDSEVRRLQVRGSARVAAFVRGQLGGQRDDRLRAVSTAGRSWADTLRSGQTRTLAIVWVAIVAVLLIGSRNLITGSLPSFGDFPEFPDRPWTLFGQWFSGFRSAGLGSSAPAPTGFALLGVAGTALLGAMSLLRRIVLVGLLPLGIAGTWRLGRELESPPARVAMVVLYLAIPLPYDAIASGRWGGLIIWAVAPWWVGAIAKASRTVPYGPHEGVPHEVATPIGVGRRVLGLGLATAVVAAFVPIALALPLVIAVGWVVGGLVAGGRRGGLAGAGTTLTTVVGATALAFVLHLPWTLDLVLPGSRWAAFAGVRSVTGRLDVADLIRFNTGPVGGTVLGFAFVAVAALPLVLGRSWRFRLAARAWVLAVVSWAAAWAGQQSWFPHGLGPPEALLAPAAVALALAAGLGVVAFTQDLPGYRFGWRQAASLAAAAALVLGVVPVAVNALDGRWNAPATGFDSVLGFLRDEPAPGGFRVLWVGDPQAMPVAGWGLRDGVAFATTDHPLPSVEDRWISGSGGESSLVAESLRTAESGGTTRLGRLLAPMAVRYVIVPNATAPGESTDTHAPGSLTRAFDQQLDLQTVLDDPTVRVYRNDAAIPMKAALTGAATEALGSTDYVTSALRTDWQAGATPLDADGRTDAGGPVPADSTLYVAAGPEQGWSASVDGRGVTRTDALGWANAFDVGGAGKADVSFSTPLWRRAVLVLQAALWIVCIVALARMRRKAMPKPDDPNPDPNAGDPNAGDPNVSV